MFQGEQGRRLASAKRVPCHHWCQPPLVEVGVWKLRRHIHLQTASVYDAISFTTTEKDFSLASLPTQVVCFGLQVVVMTGVGFVCAHLCLRVSVFSCVGCRR